MSRSVTISAGWARTIALLAVATLLAGLATVTTSVVAPRSVFAEPQNCNSIMNPENPQGITVTIVSIGGVSGMPAFYDAASGNWYDRATGGTSLGPTPALKFRVDYGRLAQRDKDNAPWCVYPATERGNNRDYIEKGSLPASDSEASVYEKTVYMSAVDYPLGTEICVGARLPARDQDLDPAKGAPKDHDCFTPTAWSPNPTGTATVTVALNKGTYDGSVSGDYGVVLDCGTAVASTLAEGTPSAAAQHAANTSCSSRGTSAPAAPSGWHWATQTPTGTSGSVPANDNLGLVVTFRLIADTCDPLTEDCGEVLSVVTEKPATAPPTDGLASSTSSTVPALGVLLLILAAILGTMGWFTPATKRIRR